MTPAQLATLKAAINGTPALAAFVTNGQPGGLADYLNAVPTSGATTIWRSGITTAELNTAVVWSDFALLLQGQRDAYMAMTQGGTVDATVPSIRVGFSAAFGVGSASLTALSAIAQRSATRLEAIFTTSGVSSMAGQRVTVPDIITALAS